VVKRIEDSVNFRDFVNVFPLYKRMLRNNKGMLKNIFVMLFAIALFAIAVTLPILMAEEKKSSVLITGANRGLGLELTKQFLKDDYIVYGTARKPEEATELKESGAVVLPLDVTSDESIKALAEALKGKVQPLK